MKTTETQELFQGFEFSLKAVEPDIVKHDVSIIYIHGQAARNQHRKATAICQMAQDFGCRFYWYELAGHANNLEKYQETDIFTWINQLRYLLENKIQGKVIIVGSCVGGITGLFAAASLPNRISGLICLGSANINWRKKLSDEENETLKTNGFVYHCLAGRNIPFILTEKFISSADNLLARPVIKTDFPVFLFAGKSDPLVDEKDVLELYAKIKAPKKVLKLIRNASHGMRDTKTMAEVKKALHQFLY